MDAPLYDVYLTGKLADGILPAVAAQRLAALFKSTPEAMAALITGKPQLLKRGIDKNTALKYREALQKAGCEVAFKAQASAAQTEKAMPAATPASPAAAPVVSATTGLQLAPAGEALLRAEERRTAPAATIETTHLGLAPIGPLPSITTAAVAPPDTSHLSLAAAGGNLLNESEREVSPALAPDISNLSLAEAGAPIETLKTDLAPLQPDTSGLDLAPVGSDLLTPEQRQRPAAIAPDTDHITLAT